MPTEGEQEDIPLLRVGVKSKLPKFLSYPLSAKDISRQLVGCAAHASLEIWFWFHNRANFPRRPAIVRLSVWRSAYSQTPGDSGEPQAYWRIQIEPVAPQDRREVRLALLAALPTVREWLDEHHHLLHREGGLRYDVSYDLEGRETCYEEFNRINPEWI